MGSSQSSKNTVPNTGIEEVSKLMILKEHQECILKCKLEEIKGKEYKYKFGDKWFIDFLINNSYKKFDGKEEQILNQKIKYIQNFEAAQ